MEGESGPRRSVLVEDPPCLPQSQENIHPYVLFPQDNSLATEHQQLFQDEFGALGLLLMPLLGLTAASLLGMACSLAGCPFHLAPSANEARFGSTWKWVALGPVGVPSFKGMPVLVSLKGSLLLKVYLESP